VTIAWFVIELSMSAFVEYLVTEWYKYAHIVEPYGDAIVDWARPSGHGPGPAELGKWPLSDFASASAIAIVYLGFVFTASAVQKATGNKPVTTGECILFHPIEFN